MKHMTKLLLMAAIVLTVILAMPTQADAATVDDLTYYIVSKSYVYIDDCDTTATGELVIPETISGYPVRLIDDQAFSGCTKLTSVTVPKGVSKIGDWAFRNCTNLVTVSLPDTIEHIGNMAFAECTKLTNLSIPESIKTVGYYAFSNCNALPIKAHNNARYIGNTENPYLVLIDNESSSISQCTIHPDAKVIAGNAFSGNSHLSSITIPGSIVGIGEKAFYQCTGLRSVTICEGVSTIGGSAFYNCSNLLSLTLPNSIVSISSSAFSGCSKLQDVYISDIAPWCSRNYADQYTNSNPLTYADNLYLNGSLVTDLVIPDSITSIGTYAFANCQWLNSITIPDSVTAIGEGVFYNCDNLAEVTLGANTTTIGTNAFNSCSKLSSITLPKSITSIGQYAFCDTGLKEITIPDSVASIAPYTFQSCKELCLVKLGNKVDFINNYAFAYCSSLTEITIPDSVRWLGNCAFYNNQSLTRVTLGKSLFMIEASAFSGCSSLQDIVFPIKLTTVKNSAFSGCTALADVYYAGDQLQWNSITIGDSNDPLKNATLHLNYVPCTHSYTDYTDLECDNCDYVRAVQVISIYQMPTVLEYDLFQSSLDVTDGIIEFLYSDGTKGKIEMTADMVSGFDNTVLGTQILTITYHGATASYTVEVVIGNPEALIVDKLPNKLSYLTGESISLSGIALKLGYPGGQTLDLAASYVTADAVDMKTAGKKTVTLHFGHLSAAYDICVHAMEWVTVDSSLYPESVHNYLSNTNETQILTVPGATQLKLTFSADSYTEEDYDTVTILDGDGCRIGQYSGDLSGLEVTVQHDTVQVTLASDGLVNKYGYAFSSIAAYAVHHPEQIIPGSEPNCTDSGVTDGAICEICDEILQEQELLPALGHDEVIDEAVEPSCTVIGWTEGKHCDRCGEILIPQEELVTAGHSYGDWVVTKLPTFTAQGRQERNCTLCNSVESETIPVAVAEVEKWNISIQDDLVVNLHLNVTQLIEKTTKVKITVGTKTTTVNLSELEKVDDLYLAKVELSAAQMIDDIIVMIVNGSKIGCTEMYSVRQYADTILEDESHSQYHSLVKEMLNYGAAAQVYFDYGADNLANDGITDAGETAVPEKAENEWGATGGADGISFYAASLLYRDKVAVRMYFKADTVEGLAFTANGSTCTPQLKDGLYYVDITDILPQNLDQQILLTVTDTDGNILNVSYGPMNYIVRMNQKGSEGLKALVKALYNYHLAAKEFVAPN